MVVQKRIDPDPRPSNHTRFSSETKSPLGRTEHRNPPNLFIVHEVLMKRKIVFEKIFPVFVPYSWEIQRSHGVIWSPIRMGAACCARGKAGRSHNPLCKVASVHNDAIPHRGMLSHIERWLNLTRQLLPIVKRVVEMNVAPAKSPSAIAVLHKTFDLLDALQAADGAEVA